RADRRLSGARRATVPDRGVDPDRVPCCVQHDAAGAGRHSARLFLFGDGRRYSRAEELSRGQARAGRRRRSRWRRRAVEAGSHAALIQIDRNPMQIGRTVPFEVGIVGDAKASVQAISDLLRSGPKRSKASPTLEQDLRRERDEWQRELESLSLSDRIPISPRRAIREIAKAVPKDIVIVTDIGNVI